MSLLVDGHPINGPDQRGDLLSQKLAPSADRLTEYGATATATLAQVGVEIDQPIRDVYRTYYDPETCEVHVESDITLADLEAETPPDEMAQLRREAKESEGKTIIRINATPAGGGVVIINKAWVHKMRLLGIDAHWYSLPENKEASKVTKWKFHNVMQAVSEPDVRLTEEDKGVYNGWMKDSIKILADPIRNADVIIVDDWQPSGLIPYIKGDEETPGLNPNAPLFFRDHIHTRGDLMVKDGTPQNDSWRFLWDHNRIKEADVFITHPKHEFVPPNVPNEMVAFMPATADLSDDLNRDLTEREIDSGFTFINTELANNENQTPLDLNRPYIVLIARFDESKGMPQGIESYAKTRQKMIDMGVAEADLPQFVVLGNGSVDDPSGDMMLEEIMDLRGLTKELDPAKYGNITEDLKVIRVPHNDVAINALLKGAKVALQPSIAEGFESRVTDAILQGVPVIGSDRGGIPLQIIDGESGYIIDPDDTEQWANRITELLTDEVHYDTMAKRTKELAVEHNYQFTTVRNLISWLHLARTVAHKKSQQERFVGNRRWVSEMAIVARTLELEARAA